MPDLTFSVEGAEPVLFAAAPQLAFKLRITNAHPEEPIHSVLLRGQVRLEPARRSYQPDEKEKLCDLFGEPERWGHTLRSMLWTHTTTLVPSFRGTLLLDVPVPCTFDFNVAATKYFHALEGDIPLNFLFSGTIFHEAEDGALRVAQVPWEKEAAFRLPVQVWRNMMDHYYPNTAWLGLRRDVFEELSRYKSEQGLLSLEQALERLLTLARRTEP